MSYVYNELPYMWYVSNIFNMYDDDSKLMWRMHDQYGQVIPVLRELGQIKLLLAEQGLIMCILFRTVSTNRYCM